MKLYLFILSSLFIISCTSKVESKFQNENLNFKFQNKIFKLKLTAFNEQNEIGTTELKIRSTLVYDKKIKDSIELPSQIEVENLSNSGLLLCSSADIETQKLKLGEIDCTGKIQIYIGGYESTVLQSPLTISMTEKDEELFNQNSLYNLNLIPQIKHQNQFRTLTFEMKAKYNYDQKNIDSIGLKLLGENLILNTQNKMFVGQYDLSSERKNIKVELKIEQIN
jgi:hypothetical protein